MAKIWKTKSLVIEGTAKTAEAEYIRKSKYMAVVYASRKKAMANGRKPFTFKLFDASKARDIKIGSRNSIEMAKRAAERILNNRVEM